MLWQASPFACDHDNSINVSVIAPMDSLSSNVAAHQPPHRTLRPYSIAFYIPLLLRKFVFEFLWCSRHHIGRDERTELMSHGHGARSSQMITVHNSEREDGISPLLNLFFFFFFCLSERTIQIICNNKVDVAQLTRMQAHNLNAFQAFTTC